MSVKIKYNSVLALFTDPVRRVVILFATSFIVVFLSSGALTEYFYPTNFHTGEIATRTVRAPRDLFVEDVLTTENQRANAELSVRRVFEIDDPTIQSATRELRALFDTINSYSGVPGSTSGRVELDPQQRAQIEKTFHLALTPDEWDLLVDRSLWPPLDKTLSGLVYPILHRGIIADKSPLESVLPRSGATLIFLPKNVEQPLLSESLVYDSDEAAEVFESLMPQAGFNRGAVFDGLVKKLGKFLLKPDVRFDRKETQSRLQAARETIEPAYFQIRRGETLVRAGDRVSPSQEAKLQKIHDLNGTSNLIRGFVGYFVLCCTVLSLLYLFFRKQSENFRPGVRELLVLSLALIGSIALERFGELVGNALNFDFPSIDASSISLIAPLAAAGILLQAILGPAYVLFFILSFALLTGIAIEDSWLKLLLICIGNLVGTFSTDRVARRSAFLSAALRVALINVVLVLCDVIIFPQLGATSGATAILCAAVGGLLSGVLAAGLLPVAEFIGGYVTAMKLLELASLDRALLRELSLQAPGTWNHSIVMGQLGEAAAEVVGANPLLTRVGAYYHDIGKAKKPLYFVENQTGKENRHDKLTPSMSALIIRSHVKDGVEMAKAVRLPQALIDFISQHHGTALIEFFYEKAQKEAEAGEIIDENLFRYPGPKPQTKESGVLMLADQVEAVSRTLADPTPAKIQGMVQKIINRVFASGQLDESELTLKDLHYIAKSFTRVLTGIVHRRIDYPEPSVKNDGEKTKDEKVREEKGREEKGREERSREEKTKEPEEKRAAAEVQPSHEKNGHTKGEPGPEKSSPAEDKKALKRLGI